MTHILRPSNILEIGCGDGKYLASLCSHWNCKGKGFDPSLEAINSGKKLYPYIELRQGVAEDLPLEYINRQSYDLIIFGFCLYLLDRNELFKVVCYADCILNIGGHLAIHDFDVGDEPSVVPYHHRDGLYSYKMNYPGLWLANPAYRLVSKTITNEEENSALTILKKDTWRNRFQHESSGSI